MNKQVKELRAAMEAAKGVSTAAQRKKDDWYRSRAKEEEERHQKAMTALYTEACSIFNKEIAEAMETAGMARNAYEAALVAYRRANTGWLPVGTIVAHWDQRWGRWSRKPDPWRIVEYGIIDVWEHGHEYAANDPRNAPEVGEVYIRLLKKDGTAGKAIYRCWDRWEGKGVTDKIKAVWLPEGVRHPEAKQ